VTRHRIDRFIEEALLSFGAWFESADWHGKERDCVNLFALGFLARDIGPPAPIRELTQIRIECPVPQPAHFSRPSAAKDLVIWKDGHQTTWAQDWSPRHFPWVVMEWKWKSRGRPDTEFDAHDLDWLTGFTKASPKSLGYLVRVYDGPHGRSLHWAKVRQGLLKATGRRS
jgi:hypothetical protein